MKATAGRRAIGSPQDSAKAAGVRCAFCGGTGKDPFELLSKLSRCPVCEGDKTLFLEGPAVPCAQCRGTGRQRRARSPCSRCGGVGVVPLDAPIILCPRCAGAGREPEADLPCSLCRGAGLLKGPRPDVSALRNASCSARQEQEDRNG